MGGKGPSEQGGIRLSHVAEAAAVAVLASRGLWVGWVGDGSHSITGAHPSATGPRSHLQPCRGRAFRPSRSTKRLGAPLVLVCQRRKAVCPPPAHARPPALIDAGELTAAACFLVLLLSFRFQISLFLKPSQSGLGFSEI